MNPSTPCNQIFSFNSFVGKTIKSVQEDSCNCLEIEFTDGTWVRIESEFSGTLPVYSLWTPIN